MILSKKNKAFTLIELLVVIAIIGVLAALALTNYNASRRNARDGRRLGDIRNIMGALEQYYNDNGYYPNSEYVWMSSVTGSPTWLRDIAPTYMDRVPLDPTNSGDLNYSYITACSYDPRGPNCYELEYCLELKADLKAIGNVRGLREGCTSPREHYRVSR